MTDPLKKLRAQFADCCKQLGVDAEFPDTRRDAGYAHAECRDGMFHLILTERGREYGQRTTANEDDILYWLVCDITHELASKYEIARRVPGRSPRRLLFAKQIELLDGLNPAWGEQRRAEIDTILAEHPYDDDVEGRGL